MKNATKRFGFAVAALAIMVGAVGQARAAQTVINFDNLSDGTVVTNEYQSQGVILSGASVLATGSSLNPTFPPHSGTNVVYDYLDGVIHVNGTTGTSFSQVGGYITGNTAITLEAFDAGGNLLGTDQTPGANYAGSGTGLDPNIFLSVSAPDIAYFVFHDHGNSFTLDDLTFTSAVPEPSSIVLCGMGLIGLGLGWRRRKAKLVA